MRRHLVTSLLILATLAPCARAASYYFATDVPARLGGIDYTHAQILRKDAGAYSVQVDTEGAMFKAIDMAEEM